MIKPQLCLHHVLDHMKPAAHFIGRRFISPASAAVWCMLEWGLVPQPAQGDSTAERFGAGVDHMKPATHFIGRRYVRHVGHAREWGLVPTPAQGDAARGQRRRSAGGVGKGLAGGQLETFGGMCM